MSALPHLTLIPAGAGSGKTYRIKEQLADWVETGLVKPDRIAAVTFTETAASELRERIRTTLMERGRLEAALRLDQSFISTIQTLPPVGSKIAETGRKASGSSGTSMLPY